MYSFEDKDFYEGVTENDSDGWIQFLNTIKAEALLHGWVTPYHTIGFVISKIASLFVRGS